MDVTQSCCAELLANRKCSRRILHPQRGAGERATCTKFVLGVGNTDSQAGGRLGRLSAFPLLWLPLVTAEVPPLVLQLMQPLQILSDGV